MPEKVLSAWGWRKLCGLWGVGVDSAVEVEPFGFKLGSFRNYPSTVQATVTRLHELGRATRYLRSHDGPSISIL